MSRKILTYSIYEEKTETPKIWEAKRYIVSSLSENEVGYDLTLVEYADDIYKTGLIKERQSSILSPAPKFTRINRYMNYLRR
jgi:hypothetical protein